MVSDMRTSTHHPVLPVVLPLDPPDDSVALTPRVPTARVHHPAPQSNLASPGLIAPPGLLAPQSNLASPGLHAGNSGTYAPIAGTPDPLANSRVTFASLRARMLTRQPAGPSGTPTVHDYPATAPLPHQRAPRPDGMLHHIRLPPPNPPIGTEHLPFVNLSFVVELILTVMVMADLVATEIVMVTTPLTSVAMEIKTTPLAMSRLWGVQSFPLDTVTGPCMPARWVLVVLT